MGAASARHLQTREPERGLRRSAPARSGPGRARARTRAERRRRQRHFARRRRDLLEDAALALVLTLILISLTAGLGVIALIEGPLATGLLASVLVPRWRRRAAQAPGSRSRRHPRERYPERYGD